MPLAPPVMKATLPSNVSMGMKASADCHDSAGPAVDPEIRTELRFHHSELFDVNIAHARRRYGFGRIDFLNRDACLVFIEMLPGQPCLVVIGPEESLAARNVIEPLLVRHVIT